jgi:hypothetical protein
MESYAGIVPAMVTVLRAGPVGLNRLADDLHREFGASPNSVRIMASTHPAFLVEDGVVRLRPADQPYVPKTSLTATRGCFVVDGCWSRCIKVDHDFLRGSGRQLPEAFAVHLGLEPLASGRVPWPGVFVPLAAPSWAGPGCGAPSAACGCRRTPAAATAAARATGPGVVPAAAVGAARRPRASSGLRQRVRRGLHR